MGLLAGRRKFTPSFLLVVLVLLIGFAWLSPPSVSGLKCYKCKTTNDCDDLGSQEFCGGDKMCAMNTVTSEDGHVIVLERKCAGNAQLDAVGCKKLETGFANKKFAKLGGVTQRCLCDEDLCNGPVQGEQVRTRNAAGHHNGQSSRHRPQGAMILGGVATNVAVVITLGGRIRHRP